MKFVRLKGVSKKRSEVISKNTIKIFISSLAWLWILGFFFDYSEIFLILLLFFFFVFVDRLSCLFGDSKWDLNLDLLIFRFVLYLICGICLTLCCSRRVLDEKYCLYGLEKGLFMGHIELIGILRINGMFEILVDVFIGNVMSCCVKICFDFW